MKSLNSKKDFGFKEQVKFPKGYKNLVCFKKLFYALRKKENIKICLVQVIKKDLFGFCFLFLKI